MSKLDKLLRELCPDGVEYKRFDEVCTLNARIGWQRLTKAEYMSKGDYLLITGTDFTETHEIDICDGRAIQARPKNSIEKWRHPNNQRWNSW